MNVGPDKPSLNPYFSLEILLQTRETLLIVIWFREKLIIVSSLKWDE